MFILGDCFDIVTSWQQSILRTGHIFSQMPSLSSVVVRYESKLCIVVNVYCLFSPSVSCVQVAYSRYELDEIAIFDLETKGWCIGGDILSQRVRPIPPISPQYGDRVRCYLRVGVYDASQDLCTILEEINPFSALFNPRKPNPDVDPFDDLDADGNPG